MIFFPYLRWIYVEKHIHVALAVTAFTVITVKEFSLQIPFTLWVVIFTGTFLSYNFISHFKSRRFRIIKWDILCYGLACLSLFYLISHFSLLTILTLILMGLMTFLYVVPLRHGRNLRSVSGWKAFLVAFVWAGVTVLLPLETSTNTEWTTGVALTSIQRFIIVLVLLIPFEIRDVATDSPHLKTLPQLFGIRRTKQIGYGGILVCVLLEFVKFPIQEAHAVSLMVFLIFLGLSIYMTDVKQSRYFASFWVEALPIGWWLLFELISSL